MMNNPTQTQKEIIMLAEQGNAEAQLRLEVIEFLEQ